MPCLYCRKMSCLNGSRKLHFVQKIRLDRIILYLGPEGFFAHLRNFLQVLDLHIFRGAGGIFCAFAQFSAGIGPAHFLAETTRPLGRGCLPFSPPCFNVFVWSSIVTFVFLGFALFVPHESEAFFSLGLFRPSKMVAEIYWRSDERACSRR